MSWVLSRHGGHVNTQFIAGKQGFLDERGEIL